MSSRVLSPSPSQTPPVPAPVDTSSPSTSAPPRPPPPQTFREARAAREETRYRGGIFKADGTQTLFKSPTQAEQNGNASAPKREPPQTLVAFKSLWSSLTTEEERWDVLRVGTPFAQHALPLTVYIWMCSKSLRRVYPYFSRHPSTHPFWQRSSAASVWRFRVHLKMRSGSKSCVRIWSICLGFRALARCPS